MRRAFPNRLYWVAADMTESEGTLVADGDNKRFWGRYAKFYDFEINRFSRRAYEQMYRLMSESLASDMDVLEIATGTGLIALGVAGAARSVVATDFSPQMIAAARKKAAPENVDFSVEDAAALSFVDDAFDAVIVSNALHIMPDPVIVLQNIHRVLKPGGLLIAPTFSHGHLSQSTWDKNVKMLKLIGFETYSKWSPEEYVGLIGRNGFNVGKWQILDAAFPLVYLEARSDKV
jgi:phosphatidylethanolamine/phosphatidyl-N-methylethanolamine N-methyltransferase